ncbi:MAG: HD domain-containing protein [Candidatus Omnitrophota bacterium]|nr:HD domain-containing protein [Candidatus Omnitrophota bacterium]
MAIDYKKELERAAKGMILVHNPDTLIRLIVRMIVQKVRVEHASIMLLDSERQTYISTFSLGAKGIKIPKGFARMDTDNHLVQLFTSEAGKKLFSEDAFVFARGNALLKKKLNPRQKGLLKDALRQMDIFQSVVCIPSYFRDVLLGLLLLGAKRNRRKFNRSELNFFVALAHDVAMALKNAQLFKELESELESKKRLFIQTIGALATAIDAKDHYTRGHTVRVRDLSLEIAKQLNKNGNGSLLDEKFLEQLQISSLLHDIGKIGIPESILNKDGPLDENERKCIQEHSSVGVTILEPIIELKDTLLGVKYHHERYDGSGYPEGLNGEKIPLIAAIIAVADTFDAMVTQRPYHEPKFKEAAVEEIEKLSGKHFHPDVVKALAQLHRENKI